MMDGLNKLIEMLRDTEIPRRFCLNLAMGIRNELETASRYIRENEPHRKEEEILITLILDGWKERGEIECSECSKLFPSKKIIKVGKFNYCKECYNNLLIPKRRKL